MIPPGAPLAPSSNIPAGSLGKIPGRKNSAGTWGGFAWQHFQATLADVEKWVSDGANTGLRADRFPGLDVDCSDESLASLVVDFAVATLGPAAVRVGRAPKKLLVYKTDTPFSRMRLWITKDDTRHLVEVLGAGNHYVVAGTHPTTMRPYEWSALPVPVARTRDDFDLFFSELEKLMDMLGYSTEREGDGRIRERTATTTQSALLAPSIEALRDCVALIENGDDKHREEIVKIGHAIRAAAGDNIEEGRELYVDLVERGGHRGSIAAADYSRFRAPFAVGWSFLAEIARQYGYTDAEMEFTAIDPAPDDVALAAFSRSDQDLADIVVRECSSEMRFLPEQGRFIVYDGTRWQPDAELLAEDLVKKTLRRVSDRVARSGSTAKEMDQARAEAKAICSAGKAAAVLTMTKSERAISMTVKMLDRDPWLLGVPGGMVDLRTGAVLPPDPDALISKITSVAPAAGPMPVFDKFISEVTGGDTELVRYVQKLFGYALCGVTVEQCLVLLYGPGGNGKGVLLNAAQGIFGEYATQAAMSTFMASNADAHSTELASLMGSRLVVASETTAGKRWDEAKIKALSGGDKVSARFMRQDSVVFQPQFTLVFSANHKPEVRDLDAAIKRRLHLVPFRFTPSVVDRELGQKLEKEYPQILRWFIDGALAWQAEGLTPLPAVIQSENERYFLDNDPIGQFIEERTVPEIGGFVDAQHIYDAWREWCGRNGEHVGTARRLDGLLATKGWLKVRTATARGYADVSLKPVEFAMT